MSSSYTFRKKKGLPTGSNFPDQNLAPGSAYVSSEQGPNQVQWIRRGVYKTTQSMDMYLPHIDSQTGTDHGRESYYEQSPAELGTTTLRAEL